MDIFDRIRQICQTSARPLVLEFGAHDGFDTDKITKILHSLERPFEYHAFEPIPPAWITQNLEKAEALARERPGSKVVFNKKAVGQVTGTIPFWESSAKYSQSSSIRKPKRVFEWWPDMSYTEITVEAVRFDEYADQEGLNGRIIDFIWADIQGAEVDLIKSGLELFKNVRYMFTEYVNIEHYEGEIDLAGILELLPDFTVVEDYGGDVILGNRTLKYLD